MDSDKSPAGLASSAGRGSAVSFGGDRSPSSAERLLAVASLRGSGENNSGWELSPPDFPELFSDSADGESEPESAEAGAGAGLGARLGLRRAGAFFSAAGFAGESFPFSAGDSGGESSAAGASAVVLARRPRVVLREGGLATGFSEVSATLGVVDDDSLSLGVAISLGDQSS